MNTKKKSNVWVKFQNNFFLIKFCITFVQYKLYNTNSKQNETRTKAKCTLIFLGGNL